MAAKWDTAPLPTVRNLTDLAELVRASCGLFVRFSAGPDADLAEQSTDYESGLHLPGLSVNRLDPEPWWTRPIADWLARQICQYHHLAQRASSHRGWVLTGTVAGRGPDDEPLLTDVVPAAWLAEGLIAESEAWYTKRFDRDRATR